MLPLFLPSALVASGLAAGGLMISVLGGAPLLLRLPTAQYIPIHKFLVTRFDPFMPISMCAALLCDAALAIFDRRLALALPVGAAVFLAGAMVVSLTRNVPINRWVATLDPAAPPANWAAVDPRVRWRNWNLVRTALVVCSLICNAVAAAVIL